MKTVNAIRRLLRRALKPTIFAAMFFGLGGAFNASIAALIRYFQGQAGWNDAVLIPTVLVFGCAIGVVIGLFGTMVTRSIVFEDKGNMWTDRTVIRANWWGIAGAILGGVVGAYVGSFDHDGVLLAAFGYELKAMATGIIVGLVVGALLGAILDEVLIDEADARYVSRLLKAIEASPHADDAESSTANQKASDDRLPES